MKRNLKYTTYKRKARVPWSKARAYFGDENMENPIVKNMIQVPSEGGSKKNNTETIWHKK